MKNKIEIILTDLDNTLLKSNKSISDYSLDVIKRCRKQGMLFGIATARSKMTASSIIEKLNPDIIISNGGALVNYKHKIVYNCMIPKDISNSLLADCMYSKEISEITIDTSDKYYWNYKNKSSLPKEYSHAVYNDYAKPLNKSIYKMTVKTSNVDVAIKIANQYDILSLLPFRDEPWVRIAHKDATKEYAIKALLEYLEIKSDNLAAFGDDYNDIEMLNTCGVGIAVENAIEEVKSAANYVCKSNNKDGVARFIEENIL